jgi:hypothetical protein
MAMRFGFSLGVAALSAGFCWADAARAQMHPIPPAECQTFAGQVQAAVGFPAKASEDDFTDLADRSEGRSCHIAASASGQAFGAPAELMAKVAPLFASWKEDPARGDSGPAEIEKGFTSGNRLAAVDVGWEPGPGVSCSDKEPLSACNIQPQQKLWTVTVDIVEK